MKTTNLIKSGSTVEVKLDSQVLAVVEFTASSPMFTAKKVAEIIAQHGGNRAFVQINYIRRGTYNNSYPFSLAEYSLVEGKAVKVMSFKKTP